jgi:hypothetical protein
MGFGNTLSEGYSSLLLDRLVKWYVETGDFYEISSKMLEGKTSADFTLMSAAPTSVGEWFLDLSPLQAGNRKFSDTTRYWIVNSGALPENVQVWFLTELYKLFWKTNLASHLLEKEEEEKILKKKHLTLIGKAIMSGAWWETHGLAVKRQIINLRATKKVLDA